MSSKDHRVISCHKTYNYLLCQRGIGKTSLEQRGNNNTYQIITCVLLK